MLFGLFDHPKSVVDSSLLKGAVDNHSHILYGLDDGVKTVEESLSILSWLEQQGLAELWFTPHVMEDVPNTTAGLEERFAELQARYQGGIRLNLAAEYLMDNLFRERLETRDLLLHGEDRVLVETSILAPPLDFQDLIDQMMSAGYRPLLAHPERYRYMSSRDYEALHNKGVLMQLNLPSILGFYGKDAFHRASFLLEKGWYCMTGSDCHRSRILHKQYESHTLKSKHLARLQPLMLPREVYEV